MPPAGHKRLHSIDGDPNKRVSLRGPAGEEGGSPGGPGLERATGAGRRLPKRAEGRGPKTHGVSPPRGLRD
eukprot:249095-Pyramimonas_sp.AAC.1